MIDQNMNYEREIVAQAVTALNTASNDWRERIVTDEFDLESTEYCVLAQVFGDYRAGLRVLLDCAGVSYSTDAPTFALECKLPGTLRYAFNPWHTEYAIDSPSEGWMQAAWGEELLTDA